MAKRKLNLSKLNFSDEFLTMEQALKDVTPLELPKDVINGNKKLNISNPVKDIDNKRLGVTITYV